MKYLGIERHRGERTEHQEEFREGQPQVRRQQQRQELEGDKTQNHEKDIQRRTKVIRWENKS